MLLWGVERRELESRQLTSRFPGYASWTMVSSQQPDVLLTNALAVIEYAGTVPRLPPRLHLPADSRRTTAPGTAGTPAAATATDQPRAPPLQPPTSKSTRSTSGNGRRHRKKEFQIQPSRARCEVRLSLRSLGSPSEQSSSSSSSSSSVEIFRVA